MLADSRRRIGYHGMRETARHLFGSEVVDQTSQVWGMDEEGEIRGTFRPTGVEGLWYAAGNFTDSRFLGRLLVSNPETEHMSRLTIVRRSRYLRGRSGPLIHGREIDCTCSIPEISVRFSGKRFVTSFVVNSKPKMFESARWIALRGNRTSDAKQ